MKKETVLLNIAELGDGECRTFRLADGRFSREVFAVCKDAQIVLYQNSCPHTGAPLDWMPEQFLNLDKTHIQCSTHHALFRIEDGLCVSGPCKGESLKKEPFKLLRGNLLVEFDGNGVPSADQ